MSSLTTVAVSHTRQRLVDAGEILGEARHKIHRMRSEVRHELSRYFERLAGHLGTLPQSSQVRPTCISLHNLAVSLGRSSADFRVIDGELEHAIECVGALLGDPCFGRTQRDLESELRALLKRSGATNMPCGHDDWRVQTIALWSRPYPADPARHPQDVPMALRICRSCGLTAMHHLAQLGIA